MQDEREDQAPEIESLNENTVNPEDVTDEDLEDVSGGSCPNLACVINI